MMGANNKNTGARFVVLYYREGRRIGRCGKTMLMVCPGCGVGKDGIEREDVAIDGRGEKDV